MDNLYVGIEKINNFTISLSLESLIIISLKKYCTPNSFKLQFIMQKTDKPIIDINIKNLGDFDYELIEDLPETTSYCVLPIAIVNNNTTIISGLCSVCRQIIKNTATDNEHRKLLGFREACLMACNESSIWTKFCEIDIVKTVNNCLKNPKNYITNTTINIPKDLTRFECHMSQPVRIHNMYKVAQDQAKLNKKNIEVNTTIPKEKLELCHLYSEGPFMTLADVILYPCIYILCQIFSKNIFERSLPLTALWLKNMSNFINFVDINYIDININLLTLKNQEILQEKIEKLSLYVSDPKRYKPRNRIYTKQPDIINAMNIIKDLNLNLDSSPRPFGCDLEFDWSIIPLEANPKGGALPVSRMQRKCEQLENLAKAVMKIAKPNNVIVDFCSGSGHLGILLAVKLPNCKIILLENKETSLLRAKDRVEQLKLQNIIFLQCNLDYFKANFNIGVSLHACGVATDLVIQHCLKRRASFICCPCCYGGVHDCHHITYPRSNVFKNSTLTLRDYLVLGHSADQTHDAENSKTKQGYDCMNIIDTDRKLQAEEFNYEVFLGKMIPENCTPKNNILVGIPK